MHINLVISRKIHPTPYKQKPRNRIFTLCLDFKVFINRWCHCYKRSSVTKCYIQNGVEYDQSLQTIQKVCCTYFSALVLYELLRSLDSFFSPAWQDHQTTFLGVVLCVLGLFGLAGMPTIREFVVSQEIDMFPPFLPHHYPLFKRLWSLRNLASTRTAMERQWCIPQQNRWATKTYGSFAFTINSPKRMNHPLHVLFSICDCLPCNISFYSIGTCIAWIRLPLASLECVCST